MSDSEYPDGYFSEQGEQDAGGDFEEYAQLAAEAVKVVKMDGEPYEPEEIQALEDMALPDQIFAKISFSAGSTLDELTAMRWLIDGIIPADSFGVVFGESGAHKSFLTLDMAACIASGKQWHEFDIDAQGAVLYIAAEGSMGLLQRVVAWERKHGVDLSNKLAVVRMPILADNVTMAEAFRQAAVMAAEKMGQPIAMIVVDTLARSFQGDENSAKDVGVFINSCDRWRSQLDGATVLVVAHTGKALERGIRGSSAIKAACDFSYLVKKTEKQHSVLKCDKSKDGDEPEDMHFYFERVELGRTDRKGREMASLVPQLERIGSDDEEEASTATGHDILRILHVLRANETQGKRSKEEDIRKFFVDMQVNEYGKNRDSAGKQWRRAIAQAIEERKMMKHGEYLSPIKARDPWDDE